MENKIKTILFASLIAAMVLPFSSIQVADAEKSAGYNISDRIDELIDRFNSLEAKRQQLKQDLRNTESEDEKTTIQGKITTTERTMDAIESMVGRLVAQEESYSPSDTSSARAITEGNTIRITDDHTACSNWDFSTTSTVRGTIDTNIDIISWQWDVADEKSVGWFHPFCNTVSFELITMNVRNITERESCTIVQDNNYASGDITQTCNCGLDDGDLLSWRVDTNYESNSSEDTSGNDDWRGLHRVA